MKWIIDISESTIIDLLKKHNRTEVDVAVLNGTPLPRFHGRLGDLDALREEVSSWGMNDYEPSDFIDAIDQADTIIKADKEQADGNDD